MELSGCQSSKMKNPGNPVFMPVSGIFIFDIDLLRIRVKDYLSEERYEICKGRF